ncbi:hypothetical protein [Stackebrandtia nassauensis]|uniref:PknH-like extracellular domain-containing protein n=1 Tax=Stackebrandtia nassauensis (strain DSM 44728 / CIP 108903 / NRRL B-16338 / NBRC 102104 / LLR-40K-21) TaxID=446470 RepID=D3Q3L5_STANL|nr:hypothetical protein [Stackebrandtia nassauensis]ADD42056.1 hypothetical protein Snas_2371 [Stackebrandtia nassauensis DSM 44728]
MRKTIAIGVAAVLSFALVACSANTEKPKAESTSSESTAKDEGKDWAKEAEKSLVSTDMESLSEHKAEFDKPKSVDDARPFPECEMNESVHGDVRGGVHQRFKGDPDISAYAYAVDGSAADQFEKLVKAFGEKECQEFETKTDEGTFEYKLLDDADTTEDLRKELLFGACFEVTDTKSGDKSGECRMIYVVGENGIAELTSKQDVELNGVSTLMLGLVAAEAMSG